MLWLGDIRILYKVGILAVGYQGIRVCLEEVDRVILGGNANLLKIESLEFNVKISLHIYIRLTSPASAFFGIIESFGQVPNAIANT